MKKLQSFTSIVVAPEKRYTATATKFYFHCGRPRKKDIL